MSLAAKLAWVFTSFFVIPSFRGEDAGGSTYYDVQINVRSPAAGGNYSGEEPVFADVNLEVGTGTLADRIRSNPAGFHLCISWWDDSEEFLNGNYPSHSGAPGE